MRNDSLYTPDSDDLADEYWFNYGFNELRDEDVPAWYVDKYETSKEPDMN